MGTLTLQGGNIVGDTFTVNVTTQQTGIAEADVFETGVLADNGGPVQTIALRADALNPALDASTGANIPATDARGVAAFDQPDVDNGGVRDLGAFELDVQVLTPEDPGLIVTTLDDVVDQFDGLTSLREAVAFANADGVASEITFDVNVFTGGATNLIRLTQGQIVITQALTINGAVVGGVTITGDRLDNDAVVAGTDITDVAASGAALLADNSRLFLLSEGANTTFDSLTLTGGRTTAPAEGGGAIRSEAADVTLTNSTVSGNSTVGNVAFGGAITAFNAVLTNSTISGNSTAGYRASGGGISANTATLTNSTVSGNSTAGSSAFGGGIDAGTATLVNSTVSDNSTAGYRADGGGIFTSDATLTNSTVSGNSTAGDFASGGGINAGTATLTNTTVSGNSTGGDNAGGGGISAFTAVLTNSTVSGNSTAGYRADGGGIFARDAATLTNSTVSGNSTAGDGSEGGGIAVTSILDSDTSQGDLTLNDSIIVGNVSLRTEMNDILFQSTGTLTLGNSLLTSQTVTANTVFADVEEVLVGNSGTGVFAGVLADNGGPVRTVALLDDPDNPALDASTGANIPAEDARGVSTNSINRASTMAGCATSARSSWTSKSRLRTPA